MPIRQIVTIPLLAACAAALLGCPDEGRFGIIAIDSMGIIQHVDPANPGKFATRTLPTKQIKSNNITWVVTYDDVEGETGVGFDDPADGAAWQDRGEDVLDYIARTLNATSAVSLEVNFEASSDLPGATLASAGTFFFEEVAFKGGFARDHIVTGSDPHAATIDIYCRVDPTHVWYLGTGSPGAGENDFFSVLLHEMTHGLGFLSSAKADGSSTLSGGTRALMDKDIETGNGNDCWHDTTTAFIGLTSYLVGGDNGLVYTGANATAAFGGSPPPLFAPNPFQQGSGVAHWDTGNVGGAVMEHSLTQGTAHRKYAAIDIGLLKDIGYANAAQPLPLADFSSSSYAVAENGGSVTVTVTLTEAPGTGNAAQVDFTTSDNTATANEDYTGNSGTMEFGATDISQTLQIAILDDGEVEGDETITVTLFNPIGCALAGTNNPATITIQEDDVPHAEIWVDFGHEGAESGSSPQPFNTLAEAVTAVDANGTIKIKSDVGVTESSEAPLIISKALRIEAVPAGSVRIGVTSKARYLTTKEDATADGLASFFHPARQASRSLPVPRAVSLTEPERIGIGKPVVVLVLPASRDDAGVYVCSPAAPLFLRLRAESAIDSLSLWADVPVFAPPIAEWQPAAPDRGNDLWIRFTPGVVLQDGTITLHAGGATVEGIAITASEAHFRATEAAAESTAIWQPVPGRDYASAPGQPASLDTLQVVAHGTLSPRGIASSTYRILPDAAFDAPQTVWLPLPRGTDPDQLALYYLHESIWYPATQIESWLVPDSFRLLELESGDYLGCSMNHAGVVLLGREAIQE